MTDGIIIFIAMVLFFFAKDEFKNISFFVLAYFVLSDALYHHFFLELRGLNLWPLYLFYNVINVSILFFLDYFKSHQAIKFIIAANILLNIPESIYFITETKTNFMYNAYYGIALSIAIFALIYMSALTKWKEFVNYLSSNSRFYSSWMLRDVLCSRNGVFFNRGLL